MKKKLDKRMTIAIIAATVAVFAVVYFGGVFGQFFTNYAEWQMNNGLLGQAIMKRVDWNPMVCFKQAFTPNGLKSMLLIIVIAAVIFGVYTIYDRFGSKDKDPRGFKKSKLGTYGTASMMTEKEMKQVLEVSTMETAEGTILGMYKGNTVCMPKDTPFNRHIAVFGASGTMKSRAVVRNALFQALKNSESVVVTDPKGELYADTAELYRTNGYEVKVLNLVNPEHGDSWNCMADLGGDTLMAQVLTNVIIGNTSGGKGDHFWDNGEGNLLKALVLYVDQDRGRAPEEKNLPAVYQFLTQHTVGQLTAIFDKLPSEHPAKAPYNLFAQASDTVRSGIVLGLGTRLQVLQNRAVQHITTHSDIDITAPGKHKCA